MKIWLKKRIPSRENVLQHRLLNNYRHWFSHPHLFYLNGSSVSRAFAVGLFWAWIPMPFQMLPAALFALYFKANLPLSMALVWITNPVTMPPLFFFAYQVGKWTLGPAQHHQSIHASWDWFSQSFIHIWQPFLLGCLLMAIFSSAFSYSLVRWLWKRAIVNNWRARQQKRLKKAKALLSPKKQSKN